MSWDKIHKMINESKKEGDPLANMIADMDIVSVSDLSRVVWKKRGLITVFLGDGNTDNQEEELMIVELDTKLTAYQNSKSYYEWRKK